MSTTNDNQNIAEHELNEKLVNPVARREPFIDAIVSGEFDGQFADIENAMKVRRSQRQSEVLAQVKEVFGSEYDVKLVLTGVDDVRGTVEPKSNPFVQHAQEQEIRNEDEPIADALSDTQSELEAKMIAEGNAGEVSIESRGAIIGGLSSSQIG